MNIRSARNKHPAACDRLRLVQRPWFVVCHIIHSRSPQQISMFESEIFHEHVDMSGMCWCTTPPLTQCTLLFNVVMLSVDPRLMIFCLMFQAPFLFLSGWWFYPSVSPVENPHGKASKPPRKWNQVTNGRRRIGPSERPAQKPYSGTSRLDKSS